MTTTAAGRSYIDVQWRKCWSIRLLIYHHLWSKINIMSSTGSSRPLISLLSSAPVLAQPLDLLVADIWICLETAFGFVFKNIYISPGFNFPYFRSSPLSISPCWMASYFPVKLPRKENHFWHGLHLKSGILQSNVWNRVLLRGERVLFGFLKICTFLSKQRFVWWLRHVRRQFWQSSWSLHLFTESTSGQKWTTSPRLAPQCPNPAFK